MWKNEEVKPINSVRFWNGRKDNIGMSDERLIMCT